MITEELSIESDNSSSRPYDHEYRGKYKRAGIARSSDAEDARKEQAHDERTPEIPWRWMMSYVEVGDWWPGLTFPKLLNDIALTLLTKRHQHHFQLVHDLMQIAHLWFRYRELRGLEYEVDQSAYNCINHWLIQSGDRSDSQLFLMTIHRNRPLLLCKEEPESGS